MKLQQFPSLALPLSSSPLVGLYFASSWCPDCTPITPKLKLIYESQKEEEERALEIVYISSDNTLDQFQSTLKNHHGAWSSVPFNESSQELSLIKSHFGVCAMKEMKDLKMKQSDRKFGIPTLILIDSQTQEVVSTQGVKDVEDIGLDCLKKWTSFLART